jgi:GGDEF domain-containing protein
VRYPPEGDAGRRPLNEARTAADALSMTIAPNYPALAVAPAIAAHVTALLPQRDAVLDAVAARLLTAGTQPSTLVVLGLLRRDDGWPTPQPALAAVTSFLARSLRGDDWLGSVGATEFGILLAGNADAAQTAATRLVHTVGASVPDMAAAAGIAPLASGLGAAEVLRRATLSLTAARSLGGDTVLGYREPA